MQLKMGEQADVNSENREAYDAEPACEILYDSEEDDRDSEFDINPEERMYMENPGQFKSVKYARYVILAMFVIGAIFSVIRKEWRITIGFVVGIIYSIALIRKSISIERRVKERQDCSMSSGQNPFEKQ